jgi:aspartate carbamoyltransferase regulatory subunit
MLTKGEIDQKEIAIISLYAPNINAPNFIKHTLKYLKAYITFNTVVEETLTSHYHQYIGHPNKKSIKKS